MVTLAFYLRNKDEAFDLLTELELATTSEDIVSQCEELREALASGAYKDQESKDVPHGT
jgi:hypothetical protein